MGGQKCSFSMQLGARPVVRLREVLDACGRCPLAEVRLYAHFTKNNINKSHIHS